MVLIILCWSAYGFVTHTKNDTPNTLEYLKWESTNIKNYSFLLNSSCPNHNAKNLRIEVRNRQKVWPRDEIFSTIEAYTNYPNIEQLFSLIDKAKKTADYHKVYYHNLGFPQYASIDWNEEIIDEECGFIVEQFRILNGVGPIPSLHTKARIKEPRFVLPEDAYLFENCCSLGPLRTREERDEYLKKYALPKSVVTDSF